MINKTPSKLLTYGGNIVGSFFNLISPVNALASIFYGGLDMAKDIKVLRKRISPKFERLAKLAGVMVYIPKTLIDFSSISTNPSNAFEALGDAAIIYQIGKDTKYNYQNSKGKYTFTKIINGVVEDLSSLNNYKGIVNGDKSPVTRKSQNLDDFVRYPDD